jgi:CRP-like cAMP-binding protein
MALPAARSAVAAPPDPFRRLPLLIGIPPATAARFAPRFRWLDALPGQELVGFDDPTSDLFFVATGQVRITVRTEGGQELILEDIAAGGFFGEMAAIDGAPRSAAVTALNRSQLARLPASDFLSLAAEAPELSLRLMRILVARLRQMNERMLDLTTLDIRHRLYAELLRLAIPAADGTRTISPPPVQHILANRIGSRREPVSREIASLCRAGLLRRTRGALILSLPDALEERIAVARRA